MVVAPTIQKKKLFRMLLRIIIVTTIYLYLIVKKLNLDYNKLKVEPTQNTEEDPNQEEESNIRKVKVNDLGEAKDYLAETFGVSRTSLRGQKAILEAAKANNIEFEGL